MTLHASLDLPSQRWAVRGVGGGFLLLFAEERLRVSDRGPLVFPAVVQSSRCFQRPVDVVSCCWSSKATHRGPLRRHAVAPWRHARRGAAP
jgi:hypothetical protein